VTIVRNHKFSIDSVTQAVLLHAWIKVNLDEFGGILF